MGKLKIGKFKIEKLKIGKLRKSARRLRNFFKRVLIRRPFSRGIRRRWLIYSLGLVFMIVLLAVTAYSVAASAYYISSVQSAVYSRATTTANFFSRWYTNSSYQEYYMSATRYAAEFGDKDKLELQFVSQFNRVEVSSVGPAVGTIPGTPDVREALSEGRVSHFIGIEPLTGERILSVSAPLLFNNQVVGVMRYLTSMSQVDNQIVVSAGTAVILGVILMIFVASSNLFFIRSILLPIQDVNEIAKKISDGSYGASIDKKYDDEIGELVDTINNMSAEISLAERIKNEFISSVSHELRTPLTAIAGWGETLLSSNMNNVDEMRKGIRIMLKEAIRLTKLVEEMLEFTRMEGGRLVLQIEPLDIRAEFEEVVYLYIDTLANEGILLTYGEAGEIPEIEGDKARLRQVFINVLDNAAKHGGDGRRIDTAIFLRDNMVNVRIQDYGMGIPAEEMPHIKKKFYKANTKSRGSGIGLAISDEIVRLHDGALSIESKLGEGTTVTISLPHKIGGLV